jgi:hypothetical protein
MYLDIYLDAYSKTYDYRKTKTTLNLEGRKYFIDGFFISTGSKKNFLSLKILNNLLKKADQFIETPRNQQR